MKKLAAAALFIIAAACAEPAEDVTDEPSPTPGGELTVYSGRSEELVGPVIEAFEEESGIEVSVRYGETPELAAQILEEGDNSPADVFFAQDAGALGAVAAEGAFAELPEETLDKVPAEYRSQDGRWVGTSGRARVLVYNTEEVEEAQLPDSVLDLTNETWNGRVGWAPTNGSFQAFVTALRKVEGEDAAREWLEGMEGNDVQTYDGNDAIVKAVASGEIDAGLANHYYVFQIGSEDATVRENAANHFFEGGDVGSIVNVAGVGILETADNAPSAQEFVDYLLSGEGRDYFDEEVFEYPLVEGREPAEGLPPLDDIEQPDIDLSDLADIEATQELMREAGVL